jgi:hypothetical protein
VSEQRILDRDGIFRRADLISRELQSPGDHVDENHDLRIQMRNRHVFLAHPHSHRRRRRRQPRPDDQYLNNGDHDRNTNQRTSPTHASRALRWALRRLHQDRRADAVSVANDVAPEAAKGSGKRLKTEPSRQRDEEVARRDRSARSEPSGRASDGLAAVGGGSRSHQAQPLPWACSRGQPSARFFTRLR